MTAHLFLMPVFAVVLAGCGPSTTQTTGDTTPASDGSASDGASESSGGGKAPSGPKAPGFTLRTLDGDRVSLSDFAGEKVVLLDFWSTTCDPCLAEMPELIELYRTKKGEGLEILAISTDGPETLSNVSATVSKIGMPFPVLLDMETEVMDRYNPKGELPFTVVVDRNGHIVLKRASYQAGDKESLRTLVQAIDGALAR
jgi:peroxiredoxin